MESEGVYAIARVRAPRDTGAKAASATARPSVSVGWLNAAYYSVRDPAWLALA